MIAFACSHCGQTLSVSDDQTGKTRQCPHCGGPVCVPVAVVAAEAAPLPPSVDNAVGTAVYVPQTATEPPALIQTMRPATDAAVFALPGYEILGELGRGGMGVIYKARQLQPRRPVAIKVILAAEHASADALARFHSEAEAAARLSHPNIVPIYEVGEHNGRPYLTLEFVEGGNLAQKLSAGPLPCRAAAELLHQLARAVDFAHERGIIHRDLTPANILLARDGTPKITDFGLAKHREGMVSVAVTRPRTQSGAILGTPCYMAPEQAGGKSKNIGPATDVYGLGAILYECLTGRPPFQAETTLDILLKVTTEEPIAPRKLCANCPRDLETIALKCLEKEPPRRYDSAAVLADDLHRYLDDKPIACRPPGQLERLRRALRKRKVLVSHPASFFAGVLATLGFSFLLVYTTIREYGETSQSGAAPSTSVSIMARDQLPPDLALVPRDAFAFASVRLADLWKHDAFADWKEALNAHEDLLPDGRKLFQEAGLDVGDIERLTLVAPLEFDLNLTLMLALRNPYDLDRVLKAFIPQADRKSPRLFEGQRIYSSDSKRAINPSLCPFSDRILLLGPLHGIQSLLQDHARGRAKERKSEALTLAAGSHAVVIEARPSPRLFALLALDVALSQNKLDSLRELERATLVVDLPARTQAKEPLRGLSFDLALHFPDAARARPGLSETMEFLKHAVGLLEANDGPPELRPLTGSLLRSLRSVAWRQDGSAIRLALQLSWAANDVQNVSTAVRQAIERSQSQYNLIQIGQPCSSISTSTRAGFRPPPSTARTTSRCIAGVFCSYLTSDSRFSTISSISTNRGTASTTRNCWQKYLLSTSRRGAPTIKT